MASRSPLNLTSDDRNVTFIVERPSEQADDSEVFYTLTQKGAEMAKRVAAGKVYLAEISFGILAQGEFNASIGKGTLICYHHPCKDKYEPKR